MKRSIAWILCAVLLVAALPGPAVAVSDKSRQEAVKQEVSRVYQQCLALSDKESFAGYCGLMTSMQLWQLGVNENLEGTYDGNKQFDYYAPKQRTTGGCYVSAYSAQEFTLGQALNHITRNGKRDVEKILVGFESTNTESGAIHGHACVIHKIMDGKVYFVENFDTTVAGKEGSVICLTINEFVNFYAGWAVLDGVVYFEDSRFASGFEYFGTDIYVRTRFESALRSEPCLLGQDGCVRLRSLRAGETLHATSIYLNDQDELFYCVSDGGRTGYVAANAVSVVRLNEQALVAQELSAPTQLAADTPLTLSGEVSAEFCGISTVGARIINGEGKIAQQVVLDVDAYRCSLEDLNEQLEQITLEAGIYQLELYAKASFTTVKGLGFVTRHYEQPLFSQSLIVGEATGTEETQNREADHPDGWSVRDGIWYYYDGGAPCTGWVTYLDVEYYLGEDGAATTGWAEVDGQSRYFTDTGALHRGWLRTDEGVYYWLSDGTQATGWQTIEGVTYYFGEDFRMVTEGTADRDGVTYRFEKDGRAVEATK